MEQNIKNEHQIRSTINVRFFYENQLKFTSNFEDWSCLLSIKKSAYQISPEHNHQSTKKRLFI